MNQYIYSRLSTTSKRAIAKTKKKFGRKYEYSPRVSLVKRLATEFKITDAQMKRELWKIREELINQK
jgi:hypothetical protein